MSESKSHIGIPPLKKNPENSERNFRLFKNSFMQNDITKKLDKNYNINQYQIKRADSEIDPNSEDIPPEQPSPLNNYQNIIPKNDIFENKKWREDIGKHKIDFKNFSMKNKPSDHLYTNKEKLSLPVNKKSNFDLEHFQKGREHSLPENLSNNHTTYPINKSSSGFQNNSKSNDHNDSNPKKSSLNNHTTFNLQHSWGEKSHISNAATKQLHILEKPLRRMSVLPELHNFLPHKKEKDSIINHSKTSILSEGATADLDLRDKQSQSFEPREDFLQSPSAIRNQTTNITPIFKNFTFNQHNLNQSDPKLSELHENEPLNLQERRASDPSEIQRSKTILPSFHQNRRQTISTNVEIPISVLKERRMSAVSAGYEPPSTTEFSLPQRLRRASMVSSLNRSFPPNETIRRRSLSPELTFTHYKNDNHHTKNKNTFKTFDFKSFQFPLSTPQEIIGQESHFDNIPGKGERSTVVKEEKVNRNNGRNKVRTIEDDNDYEDISNYVHTNNIFATLIEQEKEREKEREKHHHHHGHHGMVDYTSAVTGAFSDVMFNWNETSNDNQSQSESESTSESCNSLCNINTQLGGNEIISSKENTLDTTTPVPTAYNSTCQTPILNKATRIEESKKHRHHKSLNDNISKSIPYVNDKKRLVYQFLQSLAPPSKNQLEKQGLLFTSENPLISSQLLDKDSANTNNGITMSSNRSLQSLLFHDLEQPEYLSDSPGPSPYSRSSYSLSSYSSSSYSSDLSSTSSNGSKSNEDSSNQNRDQMDDILDRYDVDYYQRHIALLLSKFDDIMKSHLKGAILKKEIDFQRTLQNFDNLVDELQKLKKKTIDLETLIKSKYLVKLTKDFGDKNSDSFIEVIKKNVTYNIKQLEAFETRMSVCQQKLATQKRDLKKMESLLQIEQSIIQSKKSLGFFSKYRYMIFDLLSLLVIVFIVLIFVSSKKWEMTSYIFAF
ncbi:Frt2p PWA37_002224 [Arxiozyma heterogenica]|uniref:Frt2p n=1 Tax=Arxiozyma heterogenica TaxID=278026 RepID=UPI002F1EC2A5